MATKAAIVLGCVLRVMRPLVRLLIRNGVPYPAFATALKHVFVEAARAELASRAMAQTDSAITLLSGVHRRDVRNLGRPASSRKVVAPEPRSLPGEVIARWLSDPAYLDAQGAPRLLPRGAEDEAARSTRWWPASAMMCARAPCSTSSCGLARWKRASPACG
jgi:hypothetical protein